jgi:hypothetical protein
MKLNDAENTMYGSYAEHGNTQMPPVVEQRHKKAIQPGKRADTQYHMQ